MPDIAAIGAILASVKTATEIAKHVRETDFSLDKAELKLRLADLVSTLADVKMEVAALQEVIEGKDREIAELKEAFESKDELVRRYDAYYRADKNGSPVGEPFCVYCWEESRKQRQLALVPGRAGARRCNVCKNEYDGRTARSNPSA